MAVKSPVTYGDYYWKQQVEANEVFDESIEDVVAPFFADMVALIPEVEDVPPAFQKWLNLLASPQHAGMGGFALGLGVETLDEALGVALGPLMSMMKREYNRRSRETWLTSAQANLLFARKKIPEEFWETVVASEGYEDVLGGFLYKSQQPYPSIPDLILYSRYHGDPDNVWSTLQDFYNIDPLDFKLWEWLAIQRLTTEQVQTLYRRGKISDAEFLSEIARIGWHSVDRETVRDLSYTLPNAMLLTQGNLMQGREKEDILTDISRADIHPDYAGRYLDGILTKPATVDVINYLLRQDPSLSGLDTELKRIGIHPEYFNVYKTLAYQIPPVQDIITMAVREAFTPEIATRFGQYQDYPADFGRYAAMKGLTEEWAKRYWAAHWALPSPQQGFQMLHRGVIDREHLDLLLRAQDVMPFWREKLVQIAYRPLTRVDVRRMYGLGVLDERGIVEAYLEHGYNPRNAERMAEFTIKQTLKSQSKFTSGDIVKAFADRMINQSTAISLLVDIGIQRENAVHIINTAAYKRQWEFTEQQIKGIRNLYKREAYDETTARAKLARLNLPSDQIDVLMQQWYYDKAGELSQTWTTAQTLSFLRKGLIKADRARIELRLNGYDDEHIDVYLRSLQ